MRRLPVLWSTTVPRHVLIVALGVHVRVVLTRTPLLYEARRKRVSLGHFAHTKKFENRQPPLFRFAMAERQSKRLQPSIRGRPKGPRATCINLDHDSERRWK